MTNRIVKVLKNHMGPPMLHEFLGLTITREELKDFRRGTVHNLVCIAGCINCYSCEVFDSVRDEGRESPRIVL